MNRLRRWPRLSVFLIALAWIFALEERFRNEAAEHLYFHAWTSEYMMQTLSVGDLRLEPFKSLWYNHIQPPVFDAIRAGFAAFYPNANGEALMRRVDAWLYGLWTFVYAATAVLIFSWFQRVLGDRSAVAGSVVFLLLPGPIFYATFLDTTLLSATLILWFFWTLWRFGRGEAVSAQLVLVLVVLFFTRSVFQWPFLVVLGTSAWLMGVPRARAGRVLMPIAAVMLAFLAKQYVLFGLTTTSSFGPDSFCKGLSEYCQGTTRVDVPRTTDRFNAFVLRRAEKLNGEYNYNQEAFLKRSFSQMEEYKALLRRLTPGRAFELLKINLNFYLRPTSRHSSHVIVDRLPWREPLEFLLSGWSFVVLLILSIAAWIRERWKETGETRRRGILHGLGLGLPALYVAAVTIVFESGENMRYRFFLEPTLFVFFWISLSRFLSPGPARTQRKIPIMSQAIASQSLESLARVSPGGPRLSKLAAKLEPSTILKVAGEIRAMQAAGKDVCDLTVGDFDPKYFPIPEKLRDAAKAALDAGATNYPHAAGIPALRESVQRFYARHLGLNYPLDSILIAAGARPLIYALFRVVVEPGDTVSYPAPCWNYPFYADILNANGDAVICAPEDAFQPRSGALDAAIKKASLLIVNTPLNPAGTVTPRAAVLKLSETIIRENETREKRGERPIYLMYDHIYWMLSFGVEHVTPCALVPEMAKYTIFIDGISKCFAATGLRVGWAFGPTDVIGKMNTMLMHMGGWAPKPEQTASAAMLDDDDAIVKYHAVLKPALTRRLTALHQGFQKLKALGHAVDSIEPTGAIYVSARVHPFGKKAANGVEIRTNEDVRRFLLEGAGLGVVPFHAFGVPGDTGWMRLSVGSVSEAQIESGLTRLGAALRALV